MLERLVSGVRLAALLLLSCVALFACGRKSTDDELLNVSYDSTRELYQELNPLFAADHEAKTGRTVWIKQSHGGSGKQARSVVEGLEADVVTLALGYDIDSLAKKKVLPEGWSERLPNRSAPYTSTIVFLVRKGNPKQIDDWDDLTGDVKVITPNPKTSGGARWNYLAAWAYALEKHAGNVDEVRAFMKRLFGNVPVLDAGARGSTTTFVERNIGDVLIAWENEALLSVETLGKGQLEIVIPSMSILAEPPVAVVDKYAGKHETTKLAEAYLEFLYTDAAQAVVAKHGFRPSSEKALEAARDRFPKVRLVTVDEVFGGWRKAQSEHFDDGGELDRIYEPGATPAGKP